MLNSWKHLWRAAASLAVAAFIGGGIADRIEAQDVYNFIGADGSDFSVNTNWESATPPGPFVFTPAAVPPGALDAAFVENGNTAVISSAVTVDSINAGGTLAPGSSGAITVTSTGSVQTAAGVNSNFATTNGSTGTLIIDGGSVNIGDVSLMGPQSLSGDLNFADPAGATGRYEQHGASVVRVFDDFRLGNGNVNFNPMDPPPAQSMTSAVIDGTSTLSVGDGLSTRGALDFTVSDDAVVTFGNTKGPGDATGAYAEGSGFVNIGARSGSMMDLVIEGNAQFNLSRLQNNVGTSSITIRDNGEFNIFNTSTGGTEADFKGQSYLSRDSNSNGPSSTFVTLEGSGKFTVDSNPATVNADGSDGHIDLLPQAGLTIAGGDDEPIELPETGNGSGPGGNNGNGGIVVFDIKDSAELMIVQELWMTYGKAADASSTLKVTGPNATVSIGGDLNMAVAIDQRIVDGPNGNVDGTVTIEGLVDRPGTAELLSVITGSAHSTIMVGDEAVIGNGELAVELDGYNPVLGDSYTLLQTGNSSGVDGEFRAVDLSLAPLDAGLLWNLDYFADSVVLSVVPEPTSMLLALTAAVCMLGRSGRSQVK